MTRDDIIRMAREAGYGDAMSDLHASALERFANLVAAHARQWVGLTDEEINAIPDGEYMDFYKAIEAKLKEKNT